MGYAKMKCRKEFLDLSEDGDIIFVEIRNPKTLPMDRLRPKDIAEDAAPDQIEAASFELMASIVTDWHVYDAGDESADPPALVLPATADMVRSLPLAIIQWIGGELEAAVAVPQ